MHQRDSIFEKECGKETSWCLFLHDGREVVGRITKNAIFEFHFSMEGGESEEIHKVNVNFLCPASFRDEIHKQMKSDAAVAQKAEGPHFSTRYRHHIKNKSLYPLMNRREVLFFTMLKGEVLRGIISAFSRYEIDLSEGTVSERQLCADNVEMPRINEALTGRPHRFVYTVLQPTDREMRGVTKIDVSTGGTVSYQLPPGDQNSEPVFVVDPARCSEEDGGWLLLCAYRAASDTSDVVILDAQSMAAVAVVSLPVRIPAGFHGAWLPD